MTKQGNKSETKMPMSKKSKILRFGDENVPNANLFCAVISSKSVKKREEKVRDEKIREGKKRDEKGGRKEGSREDQIRGEGNKVN